MLKRLAAENAPRILTLALVVAALAAVPPSRAEGDDDDDDDGGAIPFEVAEIYVELNDTDGDLGLHGLIDGDAWERLVIDGPHERQHVKVKIKGPLARQGLTEFFFESAEPSFDELPPERFFRRFPEGEYEISGRSIEGDDLESTTTLTHLVPAPPGGVEISGEAAAEDCDAPVLPSVGVPVVLSWTPVTLSHPDLGRTNEPIEVVRYEVVVEQEDLELVFSVTLPPDVTSFTIPSDFIALGDEFKFEIVVREESGNQTAVESCFEVE